MHRSQMKTPGPATSLETSSFLFPQKEQCKIRCFAAPPAPLRLNTACQVTLTDADRQDLLTRTFKCCSRFKPGRTVLARAQNVLIGAV